MKNTCEEELNITGIYLVDKVDIDSNYLDITYLSKNIFKKCNKGLHEFIKSKTDEVSGNLFKTEWNCIYCGINIKNR